MAGVEEESLLPRRPVQRITRPFLQFLHVESAGGIAMVAATVLALGLANSPLGGAYRDFFDQPVHIGIGGAELRYPLWYWINDALMAIFFFVIGLEIKRELVVGELRDPKQVVLPVAAAVGGAVIPVGVFLAFGLEGDAQKAWAIPMATDIAFVVGCLALLGSRVPRGLKVLMLALAIVDDIMAVLVIAFFYSAGIKYAFLAAAGVGFGVIAVLNRVGVRAISVYVGVGAVIWLFTLKSGVHPTVAGVLLGLLTPASAWIGQDKLSEVVEKTAAKLRAATGPQPAGDTPEVGEPGDSDDKTQAPPVDIDELTFAAREAVPPIQRLEHGLHPWVAFAIMPIFALANAGVVLQPEALLEPLSLAVAAGLVVGKPLGITLAALLVVKIGWARLPEGTSTLAIIGGGALAGIGFTMALFIASLGLEGSLLASAKTGVLLGSAVSAAIGFTLLLMALPKQAPEDDRALQ